MLCAARFAGPLALVVCLLTSSAPRLAVGGDDWPEFRGPGGMGLSDSTGLAVEWGEGKNVVWKTPIPGQGWSSPVVLGGQIWMTTATEGGRELRAVCVDRDSGSLVHDILVFTVEKPAEIHGTNSHASPTPVIERGRVYVHFGANGTACLDTNSGDILWRNDELKLDHQVGPGSSPVLYGDLLLLTCDGTDVRFVTALHKDSGSVAWKTDRSNEITKPVDQRKAFTTPLLVPQGKTIEAISPGADQVSAYDPASGKELWSVKYEGFSNVPRPVFGNGLVYICTGYMKPKLMAIRPGGRGDVTKDRVAWEYTKQVPAKPSPILADGAIWLMHEQGVLTCLDAKNGKERFVARIGGAFTSSPILAEGRLYFCDEDGKTLVVQPGPKLDVVATNQLDGKVMSSPAVAGQAIYLRTDTHLYRIEPQ